MRGRAVLVEQRRVEARDQPAAVADELVDRRDLRVVQAGGVGQDQHLVLRQVGGVEVPVVDDGDGQVLLDRRAEGAEDEAM